MEPLYEFPGLAGQGNHMVEFRLHALGLDVPFDLFQIDFFPHAADQFTRAQHDVGRELKRQGDKVGLPPLRFFNLVQYSPISPGSVMVASLPFIGRVRSSFLYCCKSKMRFLSSR